MPTVKRGGGSIMALGLFHEEINWKIVHFGSYDGSLLLSANIVRESVTINRATTTWDELRIAAR